MPNEYITLNESSLRLMIILVWEITDDALSFNALSLVTNAADVADKPRTLF